MNTETRSKQEDSLEGIGGVNLSAGYQNTAVPIPWTSAVNPSNYKQRQTQLGMVHQDSNASMSMGTTSAHFVRERSSSNRNLPDTNRLQAQQRRASDELAGSSSQRLSSRLSPAASRRSISVMNVGDGGHVPLLSRPSSRLGSQGSIMKARRDSTQLQSTSPLRNYNAGQLQQKQPSDSSKADAPIGAIPTSGRSSLAEISQVMSYNTPKNSQSDSTELYPTSTGISGGALQKRSQAATPKSSNPSMSATEKLNAPKIRPQSRGSISGPSQATGGVSQQAGADYNPVGTYSGSGSRRNSGQQTPPVLQRKGSFAMMTLRKLKRTMSLTKGSEQSEGGSGGPHSRRSSGESVNSTGSYVTDLIETDLGVTRRVLAHTSEFNNKSSLKLSCVFPWDEH